MSRTSKLVNRPDGNGLEKSRIYYSSGNPYCIHCNNRACAGEIEKPRGKKSLSKTKFTRTKRSIVETNYIDEDA